MKTHIYLNHQPIGVLFSNTSIKVGGCIITKCIKNGQIKNCSFIIEEIIEQDKNEIKIRVKEINDCSEFIKVKNKFLSHIKKKLNIF